MTQTLGDVRKVLQSSTMYGGTTLCIAMAAVRGNLAENMSCNVFLVKHVGAKKGTNLARCVCCSVVSGYIKPSYSLQQRLTNNHGMASIHHFVPVWLWPCPLCPRFPPPWLVPVPCVIRQLINDIDCCPSPQCANGIMRDIAPSSQFSSNTQKCTG